MGAIGLAAASFMSFPVAAFFSASLMVVVLSSGTLKGVVEAGTVGETDHETGQVSRSPIDLVMIPAFKGLLVIIGLADEFSPIDALSTGRSITWTKLGWAVAQIILFLGGLVAVAGILIFNRRELAATQAQT